MQHLTFLNTYYMLKMVRKFRHVYFLGWERAKNRLRGPLFCRRGEIITKKTNRVDANNSVPEVRNDDDVKIKMDLTSSNVKTNLSEIF